MSKISEFYAKAISEERTKAQLNEILGGKSINEADDGQLERIGKLAQKLGYSISVGEARDFIRGSNTELDDEDLDAVAGGGKNDHNNSCENGAFYG